MKFSWPLIVLVIAGCATHPPLRVEKAVLPVDEAWLKEVATEHNHDVLICYQARLKDKPKLGGEMRLEFLASQSGEMKEVKVTKSVDSEVDRCVLSAAKSWKFPWNVRGGTFDLAMIDTFQLTFENQQPRSAFKEEEAGMDREAIRLVVKDHVKDIHGCYEAGLRTKPGLVGKIILEWNIETNGSAHDVKVEHSLDSVVESCLIEKLKTWEFPHPPKGKATYVSYPFTFTTE